MKPKRLIVPKYSSPRVKVGTGPMTDAEILKAARADPDAQPLTDAQLGRMKRPNAKVIRRALGLSQDEFIDNIPFPETQTYVKRILGTAEDYRRLYGPGGVLDPNAHLAAELPATAPPKSSRRR